MPAGGAAFAALDAANKKDFKESEHPRDEDGKFAKAPSRGGGAGGKSRSGITLATAPAAGEVGEGGSRVTLPTAPAAGEVDESSNGVTLATAIGAGEIVEGSEKELLLPAAPPPDELEAGARPQGSGDVESEEASQITSSAKEGARQDFGKEQDYSNDSPGTYDFFDEKLINEDGLQKWEERSTKGWKHSEYRKVTRTILDEPLEEFSNKIGGHKTLREFFAAVSLGDEKLDDEKMELLSLGMIYMESNGDPECKASGTKAWGLMQVTPIAAKEIDLPHDDSLFEPEHGIRAGLRYLARSTYLASGRKNYDIARGVAGYISGPSSATEGIPKGDQTTREVLVVMSILGRLEELRGQLKHRYGDRLIDYALASPEERKALKAGMKGR